MKMFTTRWLALVAAGLLSTAALADEAAIRKNISQRLPDFPKIDEVTKTSVPGIYELRLGIDVVYTDEEGNVIIQGDMFDTKSRVNVTQARVNKLSVIDFASLSLKDAVVWKQGTGARKLVVFADPNCGYCRKLERDMQDLKDVTVYTFVIAILGGDSPMKARNIWCAKNSTTAWRKWMLEGVIPPAASANCDASAIDRNLAFSRKSRINATPAIVFEDGTRIAGAVPVDRLEKQFAAAKTGHLAKDSVTE
jgi:thiol:disulfide interchange protein DsbC